ncbi:hypothetical protein DP116_05640 [Brasilonema bromeliae SPC951]|uniref:Uncharacterized protein n=1 Tax=Brasilonema bromeliae SPC951 TaxID=385972 RepID=A0ABX1P4T8_9CYAN|nr:hypothetical protein [Brasilonema bromeliae SPC951]
MAALGALFRRFFDEFNDTRLSFVELFNSKYFTSFAGMPQRLGILYCPIRLMLLSLVPTLSQTLGLARVLLLFLAITLLTLVLDYGL